MNRADKFFEAGNLYLSAYLSFRGFPMRGLSGSGKLKKILFDNSSEVNKATMDFFAESEARRLFESYRRAKDFLFQSGV